ncbi:hypothetical protein CFP56_011613 [Quercus suber]|uniref:Uncharacterized protein n=1 Tax=Quercus suber TaxID=58331 RepID=A0AAW0L1E9_QUESU|nr:hypothetical protein CFP56_06774 [Quercus suber]
MLFPLVLGQGIKRDLERVSGTHSCSSLLLCKSWSLHDSCDFLQGAGCCWVEFGKSYRDPPAYRVQRSGEGFLCYGPCHFVALFSNVQFSLLGSLVL